MLVRASATAWVPVSSHHLPNLLIRTSARRVDRGHPGSRAQFPPLCVSDSRTSRRAADANRTILCLAWIGSFRRCVGRAGETAGAWRAPDRVSWSRPGGPLAVHRLRSAGSLHRARRLVRAASVARATVGGVTTPPHDVHPRRQALGAYGERLAARLLVEQGLVVLDRNWRCPAGEIDLVLRDGDVLVVCEVKTRTSSVCGTPHEAITPVKLARLRRLAAAWVARARRPPAPT